MAFLTETLLMGMHTKPNALDALVHKLLTGVMVSCVVVCGAEIANPSRWGSVSQSVSQALHCQACTLYLQPFVHCARSSKVSCARSSTLTPM